MSEWISVKDRLPDDLFLCIVCHYKRKHDVHFAIYDKEDNIFELFNDELQTHYALEVTHFIPIKLLQIDESV